MLMTRNNRILVGAGVGALVAFLVASYFVSPVIALHGLTTAAKAGDRAKLERSVDFPAVRDSLKVQLKAAMTRSIEADPKLRDNPFAALGQMLLIGVIDKAVDAYATPDAIANMVATNKAPERISADTPPPPPVEQPKPKPKSTTEAHYAYQGLNHFHATYRDKADSPGDELGLVMERRGLFTWKLVKIELPPNLGR
jgi:hypothetical protein